jgi:hypothetical protein
LSIQDKPRRITLDAIISILDEPITCDSEDLKFMPLTKQYCETVCETYVDFALWRIQIVQSHFQEEGIIPSSLEFMIRAGLYHKMRLNPLIQERLSNITVRN